MMLTTADLLRDALLIAEATEAEVALVAPGNWYEVDGEIVEEAPEIVALAEVDSGSEYISIVLRPTVESWESDLSAVMSATEERWNAYDPRLQDFLASQSCGLVFEDLLLTVPYGDLATEVSEVETANTCTVTASFEVGEEESYILAGFAHRETATFYRNDLEAGVEFSPASVGDQRAHSVILTVNSGEARTQASATETVKVFEVLPTTTTVEPSALTAAPAEGDDGNVIGASANKSESGFPWPILGGALGLFTLGVVAFLARRGQRLDITVESDIVE